MARFTHTGHWSLPPARWVLRTVAAQRLAALSFHAYSTTVQAAMHLSDVSPVKQREVLRGCGQELLHWFETHKRALPWREDRSPYRVWLSEIMLQQTRVATVVPYYERFLARFPDVASLAAASEDEVLGLWSGLGYYSRGRNLHRAATAVVEQWSGEFPSSAAELRTLPGVGPYTAAAIASLAFGRREGVVDGNVLRVLSRLWDDEEPVDTPQAHDAARARVEGLIDAVGQPGAVNEGLMELGALVCTPRSPACGECPWQARCLALARGTVPLRPVKQPKRARTSLRVACAVVHDSEWIWLEKRPAGGLFGGLHEPPSCALRGRAAAEAAVVRMLEERGLKVPRSLPSPLVVTRTLTHRELVIEAFPIEIARGESGGSDGRFRHGARLTEVGISSAVRATLLLAWPLAGRFLGAAKDSPVG